MFRGGAGWKPHSRPVLPPWSFLGASSHLVLHIGKREAYPGATWDRDPLPPDGQKNENITFAHTMLSSAITVFQIY